MTGKEGCSDCLKKVDALIANEKSPWSEDDREQLLTFEESFLDKLEPVVVEKEVEKVVEKEVEVNVLSEEDKAALAAYKKEQKDRLDAMKKEIQANAGEDKWPTEILDKMDRDTVERLHGSLKKEEVTDYSVMGGHYKAPEGIAPLYPAGVGIETKKE